MSDKEGMNILIGCVDRTATWDCDTADMSLDVQIARLHGIATLQTCHWMCGYAVIILSTSQRRVILYLYPSLISHQAKTDFVIAHYGQGSHVCCGIAALRCSMAYGHANGRDR